MTKTYIAPALLTSGNVVPQTQNGSASKLGETSFRAVSASGTGFYL
jgi:hypothetical protein